MEKNFCWASSNTAPGGPLGGGTTATHENFARNFAAKTSVSTTWLLVCSFFVNVTGKDVFSCSCTKRRPRFGLTWPPVHKIFLRTQRRQDGQLLSHLVRAALQALQLKGNFFGESVVAAGVSFCFFDGTWPLLCDMRKAGTRFCRDTDMGIRRRWGVGGGRYHDLFGTLVRL